MAERRFERNESDLSDKLIHINRVSKTLKGGKKMSFAALVVTGDQNGRVGIGVGKSNEVPSAIQKASGTAKKSLVTISLNGSTIWHEVTVSFGGAEVILKPAAPGTGIIAGGSVRAVVEMAGIKDILTKSMGSANQLNVAKATLLGLASTRNPKEVVAKRKGLEVTDNA